MTDVNVAINPDDTTRDTDSQQTTSSSSIIGALSAAGRSLIYRITTFYLRTPVKFFRPRRFDYLHYVRLADAEHTGQTANTNTSNSNSQAKNANTKIRMSVNPHKNKFYQTTNLYILGKTLNKNGWRVIPEKILPPLVVNSITGTILYTTYLETMNMMERVYPSSMNAFELSFSAGCTAGFAQAAVSTPIDAIYARSVADAVLFDVGLGKGLGKNLWVYGFEKLREIGLVGCFGGFGLVAFKETFGFGVYFSTYEYLKDVFKRKEYFEESSKWFKGSFMLAAGTSAAFFLQVIQYPLGKIQKLHQERLEMLDISSRNQFKDHYFRIYRNAYWNTFKHLGEIRHNEHTRVIRWLYKGFFRNTLAVIPGTTMGLFFLDYLRTRIERDQNDKSCLE